MTILTAPGRELFQNFLADAFVIQESGMDAHSLCILVQIQRLIDTVPIDVDRTMNLIAEGVSNIAHANGTAIARLEANELAYRVGIGCAATYPGRRVPAVFTLSSHQDSRQEILRVENAQTDKRIEAAICKQFGARSLLILPVYHGRELTGILQVFFTQEHAFQEREVNGYRLMAGLIGEVIVRESLDRQRKSTSTLDGLRVNTYRSTSHSPISLAPSSYTQNPAAKVWSPMGCKPGSAATQLEPSYLTVKARTTHSQPLLQVQHETPKWRMAVAAIVIVFVATWIAHKYTLRETVLPQKNPSRESSLASYQPALEHHSSRSQSEQVASTETQTPTNRTPAMRVGTDYMATDVITRHFTNRPLPQHVRPSFKEVTIGDDVTVRSFTYTPAMTTGQPRPPDAVP